MYPVRVLQIHKENRVKKQLIVSPDITSVYRFKIEDSSATILIKYLISGFRTCHRNPLVESLSTT